MTPKLISVVLLVILISCHREINRTTGWDYSESPGNGGFQKVPYSLQETPPGMILIEGRTFQQAELLGLDTLGHRSFYISKYEETNGQYLEYLKFLKKHYSIATYRNALPDTTVWNQLDTSKRVQEHFMMNYLRHWTYEDYPVVGLSPIQIEKYAVWKTDRINEMILIQEGVLDEKHEIQDSTDVFTTRLYVSEDFSDGGSLHDVDSVTWQSSKFRFRRVRMEDGILLPVMRLPTETEWSIAYLGIGDSNNRYLRTEKARKIKSKDFLFLDDVERRAKKSYPPEIKIDGLQKVYEFNSNVYYLKGLDANVSEYTVDSASVVLVGGSFLVPPTDDKKNSTMSIPEIPSELENSKGLNKNDSGLYGFRLAMDCYMNDWITYHGLKKRYRYRPSPQSGE